MSESRELCVTLPVPPRVLSPNGRSHWAVKARAVKEARETAYWAAKEAMDGHAKPDPDASYTIRVRWTYGKGQRVQDQDNVIASLKPALDGIAEAMGVNDKRFRWAGIETGREPGAGHVEVTLRQEGLGAVGKPQR